MVSPPHPIYTVRVQDDMMLNALSHFCLSNLLRKTAVLSRVNTFLLAIFSMKTPTPACLLSEQTLVPAKSFPPGTNSSWSKSDFPPINSSEKRIKPISSALSTLLGFSTCSCCFFFKDRSQRQRQQIYIMPSSIHKTHMNLFPCSNSAFDDK